MRATNPNLGTGARLLREAIHQADMTEGRVAREVFGVAPASLSEWLTGKTRPRSEHRTVALEWAGIPLEAWENAKERAQRERAVALRRAS